VFGTGDCGQFGRGEDVVEASRPILSPLPSEEAVAVDAPPLPPALKRRALQVAPGGMHTLALADDGSVWSTGVNDEGALGRPTAGEVWDGKQEEEEEEEEEKMEEDNADGDDKEEKPAPAKKAKTSSSTFDSAPHLPRGDPYSWGAVSFPEGAGPFVQVSAGDSHSCALAADGRLWAWGTYRDASGVFGFGVGVHIARSPECVYAAPKQTAATSRVVKVASGADHTLALTANGEVLSWGTAGAGALGRVGERLPPRRSALEELVLKPAKVKFPGGKSNAPRIEDIFADTYSSFAIAGEGKMVFGWGLNNYGQLSVGNGGAAAVWSPVRLAALEEAAEKGGRSRVRKEEVVVVEAPPPPPPAPVVVAPPPAPEPPSLGLSGAVPEVAALVTSIFSPLVAAEAPPVEEMEVEEAAPPPPSPPPPPPPRSPSPPPPSGLFPASIVAIGAGQHHTLALTSTGAALAFGRPTYGRLGAAGADPSSDEGVPFPVRVDTSRINNGPFAAVSAGLAVSGAIVAAASSLPFPAAWGFGDSGQLGKHSGGDDAGEGDELNPRAVDLPPRAQGRQTLALEFGGQHAVLLVALTPEEEAAAAAARAELEAARERERLAAIEAERLRLEAEAAAAAAAKEAEEQAKLEAAERAAEEKRLAAEAAAKLKAEAAERKRLEQEAAAAKKAEELRLKKEAAEKAAAEKAAAAASAAAEKERERKEKAEAKARAAEEKARLKKEAEEAKEAERQAAKEAAAKAKAEKEAAEEEAARVAAAEKAEAEAAAAKAQAEQEARERAEAEAAAAAAAAERATAEEVAAAAAAAEEQQQEQPVIEEPVSQLPSSAAAAADDDEPLPVAEAMAVDEIAGGEEQQQQAPPVVEEPEEEEEEAPAPAAAAPVAVVVVEEEEEAVVDASAPAHADPSSLDPAAFMAAAPAAAPAAEAGPPFPGQLVETGAAAAAPAAVGGEAALEVAPVDVKEPSPGDFFNPQ